MPRQTVSALFETYAAAARAVERLKTAGIPDSDISLVGRNETASGSATYSTDTTDDTDNTTAGATTGAVIGGGAGLLAGLGMMAIPGLGPVVAAGWLVSTLVGATAGGATGGVIGALTESGVPESEAHEYAEGVRRGGTLVTVRTEDHLAHTAIDILDDEGTVDMSERTTAWRDEGWTGRYGDVAGTGVSTAPAGTIGTATGTRSDNRGMGAAGNATSVPIVQEDLKVGKRDRASRVRVYPYVTEKPVEKDVTLRDESVRIERTPVNRPATAGDLAREGKPLEATVRHEEPVVQKQARVVEEVRLEKEVGQHTETVRDTVKHTDVEIDDQRGDAAARKHGGGRGA
ncbi:MAG: YsnF/AvaK domain-containing protein [Hyphomicrobiaceae bacterium]|nr:YsnF/AvaK domain-containing protein [Hyphomicrobiaceae bacterium]